MTVRSAMLATLMAVGYYTYDDAPVHVVPPPPVVVAPAIPAPPVVVVPEPRCRVVRETQHDDILNTDNWVEREECDE